MELTEAPAILPRRPEPPAGLPKDAAAHWRSITALYPANHFQGANLGLLEQLCRAWSFVAACNRGIERRGLLIKGRINPLIAARSKGWGEYRGFCTKLRLSISSTLRSEAAAARADPKHGLRKPWEK